jgi:hypothetical protein
MIGIYYFIFKRITKKIGHLFSFAAVTVKWHFPNLQFSKCRNDVSYNTNGVCMKRKDGIRTRILLESFLGVIIKE